MFTLFAISTFCALESKIQSIFPSLAITQASARDNPKTEVETVVTLN